MKNFNFSRFMRITRWDLINNWRQSRNRFIGFIIAFICLEYCSLVWPYNELHWINDERDPFAPAFVGIAMFVFCLTMLFAATNIIATMQTKQQRISTLMLPGTNLEKFISRLLISTVGIFLIVTLAYFIADVVRMLWVGITGKGYSGLSIRVFFEQLFDSTSHLIPLPARIAGFGTSLIVYGCFCVGGVIFRRNSFIWSAISGIVAVLIAGPYVTKMNIDQGIVNYLQNDIFQWLVALASLAFGLIPFLVAYWLYCRLQVINNKFFNI